MMIILIFIIHLIGFIFALLNRFLSDKIILPYIVSFIYNSFELIYLMIFQYFTRTNIEDNRIEESNTLIDKYLISPEKSMNKKIFF